MKKSCKRTMRQHPGRSRLMPRELAALAFIAKAQPVATPAYQEFLGVSVSVAQRSLRKLRNLGLIAVHVSAMELPSHFTITKRAARLLSETSDQPLKSKVPRGIGKLDDLPAELAEIAGALHAKDLAIGWGTNVLARLKGLVGGK